LRECGGSRRAERERRQQLKNGSNPHRTSPARRTFVMPVSLAISRTIAWQERTKALDASAATVCPRYNTTRTSESGHSSGRIPETPAKPVCLSDAEMV
jgi:hypothetical protein